MPTARSLFATTTSILTFAVITAADPAVASSQQTWHVDRAAGRASVAGRPRVRHASHSRAGCDEKRVGSSSRARRVARACKLKAHKRLQKAPKPTLRPIAPAAGPAPAATSVAIAGRSQNSAAAIAAVLATPCQNTELPPDSENFALVRGAVLCLINRKRAESGESPLQLSPDLEQAAEGHCQELISENYFAHVSPGGETPVDRVRDTGYIPGPSVGYVIGENLAWGTYQLSTPQAIVSAWIASPGHLANILEAQYRETGIGVTPAVPASLSGGSPGATYAQEFGVIVH